MFGSSSWCCPASSGTRYLTLTSGNSAGIFIEAALGVVSSVAEVTAVGYEGVRFDVEEEHWPAFAAVKHAGLRVAGTTSHSAPYQCDTPPDAVAFVKAWAPDANIDILSPLRTAIRFQVASHLRIVDPFLEGVVDGKLREPGQIHFSSSQACPLGRIRAAHGPLQ